LWLWLWLYCMKKHSCATYVLFDVYVRVTARTYRLSSPATWPATPCGHTGTWASPPTPAASGRAG
jgi:hypothetical protein